MEMKRGDVLWADLAEPRGSEPGKRRPVVVVQDDRLTKSLLKTVMVVPITSNLRRAGAPGNVLLQAKESGLTKPSVALACQVTTIDKVYLGDRVGTLPRHLLRRMDAALLLTLSLSDVRPHLA